MQNWPKKSTTYCKSKGNQTLKTRLSRNYDFVFTNLLKNEAEMCEQYVATHLFSFKTALRGTCGLRPSESTEDIWNEDKYIPETYLPTPGIN